MVEVLLVNLPPDKRGVSAQLLLDAQQPVVLCGALAAGRGACLDLACRRRHREVGDGRVLRLAGAMGNDRGVTGLVSQLDRLDGFRDGADLVELNQNRVCHFLLDSFCKDFRIGDKQIIANQLNLLTHGPNHTLDIYTIYFLFYDDLHA